MFDSFLSGTFIVLVTTDCDDVDGEIGDDCGRFVAVCFSRGTTTLIGLE